MAKTETTRVKLPKPVQWLLTFSATGKVFHAMVVQAKDEVAARAIGVQIGKVIGFNAGLKATELN
jgi:hypothetical protein